MPVPSRLDLKTDTYNNLPSEFKRTNLPTDLRDSEFPEITLWLGKFLDRICEDINTSWSSWQSSVIYSGDTVTGTGLGTWTGVGAGGSFSTQATFTISDNFGQYQIMPILTEFVNAIETGWSFIFNNWVTTYSYSGVVFTGTSTASGDSSGTFTAVGPSNLIAFGTAPESSNIYSNIISEMPSFDLSNSFVDDLVTAISTALENQWTIWATGSIVSPTTTGVASSGSGSGTSSSINGVIV